MTGNKSCSFPSNPTLSNTIKVPSYVTKLLTEWSKAMIRTRPSDILRWTEIYFRMKSVGQHPPVKPFLDPPDVVLGPGGLTQNTLKALAMTLTNEFESAAKIEVMWDILSLEKTIYLEIIQIGNFKEMIKPKEFIGIAAAYLNNRLRDTMILLCDTFSTDNSKICIPLNTFVMLYQYLARLNCADSDSQKNAKSGFDEKIENAEVILNDNDDSQCLLSSDSQMSSNMDNEFVCDSVIKETAPDILNVESTEGIMTWHTDNMDGPDSLSNIINKTPIAPPLSAVCDDPDFLISAKKLRENVDDEDLLSLLSDSTIISDPDQSLISFVSSSEHTIIKNEIMACEEIGEEMIDGSMEDINYGENIIEDIGSEENIETDNVIKYEEKNVDADFDKPENNKSTAVEINKDYIVMLALVTNDNEYDPQTVHDNLTEYESNDSDFSLLDKTELDDKTVENTDNSKINISTFEENYYLNDEKESSDSETSSESQDFQYSNDYDQVSNASVALEKSSIQMEGSLTEIDASIPTTDKNKLHVDRSKEYISVYGHYEYPDMDEECEQNNDYSYDENDKYSNSTTKSAIISENSEINDIETVHLEELYVHVLSGIGPAIPEKQIQLVVDWVTKCARNQNNCVQEHNLLHFLCPPLDYKSKRTDNELSPICL